MSETPTGPEPALHASAPVYLDATKPEERAPLLPAEQAVLDEVNRRVAAAESLEAILEFVFASTQEIFPCDRLAIAFVEEGGDRLVAHHAVAAYEPILLSRGYAEDLAGSSLQAVIRSGRPRILPDLAHYLEGHPGSASTKLLVQEGVRSSLTCPLLVEGRVVGVLFRSARRPHAYSRREVLLHQALAERLGQAVEKARRIEQLSEANRAYTEMLGFVSHELKSPVASLVMDARMIGEGYLGPVTGKQEAKLASMIRKSEYLLGLVREYLDLARIEGGGLELQMRPGVDLRREVLEPSIEIVRSEIEASGMQLELAIPGVAPATGPPLTVEVDPDLLRIVVVNLLANGVKYGNKGGRLRLSAEIADPTPPPDALIPAPAPAGHVLVISVWNEGPGFPESQRARLFRRFSRLDTPELRSRKGTGVGLYTSWRIVKLHGGRLDASSEEGSWAEFRVTIPQP